MIEVNKIDDTTFQVTVSGKTTTTHRVTVSPDYHARITEGGSASAEDLVRASFEFLLEREPNTAILSSFDLPVIAQYFPEYEHTIREHLD